MKGNGKAKARRPIEREYLATLNAAVPLDTWLAICKRAADEALAGDAKARDWLSKWLLGIDHRNLTTLAAEESRSTPEAATDQEIESRRNELNVGRREAEYKRMMIAAQYPDLSG